MECRAETPHFWPPPKMGRSAMKWIDAIGGLTVARQPDGRAAGFADCDRYDSEPGRVRSSGRHRRVCKSGSECIAGRSEGDCFTVSVCRFACRHALTVDFAARVCRPTKNAQGRHNSLRHSLWAPLTILEPPRLEATLNEHSLPFRHKPFGDFRQLALATQRTHSIRWTIPSFSSRKDWLMASEKFATGLPANVELISASCPAFPRRITLFTPMFDIMSAPGRFRCN